MTRPQADYAAGFLTQSLGLVEGSLAAEEVPSDIVDELASVLRGAQPEDSTTPSLERKIRAFLPDLARSSLDESRCFVRKARWPGAAPVAVCLTHDVDNVERPREHIEKVRERFSRSEYAKWERGELSLYDNAPLIAERETAAGFRSSFYYLSANYPLERVRPTAKSLRSKGFEVGLHGDFGTHDSEEEMARAVDRLTRGLGWKPTGLREHYLQFDYDESWGIMDRAGFDYDTTVGNSDRLGFRLGLATPFHPPDGGWRPLRLLELPLSLMDVTLWGYLKRTEAQGYREVLAAMKAVEGVEGLFTLLWHPEAVRMKGGRIYWKVLRALAGRKGIFVGSGADVARWWRAREVPLRREGDALTFAGTPPPGMALEVNAKGRIKVRGGRARRSGRRTLVFPSGPGFKLEVSA